MSHTNSSMYFFCNSIFSSRFTASEKKTHPRAYQCIWDNYIILAQKCYNSTTCQCGLLIHKCVSKSAIVSKDAIFYLLLNNVIRWSRHHIYKKSSFLPFYSFLFLVNNTGEVICVWNGSVVNLLFYCQIIIYWERKAS